MLLKKFKLKFIFSTTPQQLVDDEKFNNKNSSSHRNKTLLEDIRFDNKIQGWQHKTSEKKPS